MLRKIIGSKRMITICATILLFCEITLQNMPSITSNTFNILGMKYYVTMDAGDIMGSDVQKVYDSDDDEVISLYGIPYGKSPEKEQRFLKSEKLYQWIGVITSGYTYCVANPLEHRTSENCLRIHVTTRKKTHNISVSSNEEFLKPVLVIIEGNDFNSGYDHSNAIEAVKFKDFVIVQISYRLGWLGYLQVDEISDSGNVGIDDQKLALQWVKDSIHLFGGDKDRVTLMGQGAGGYSAAIHLLDPDTRSCFQRLILTTGTFFSPLFRRVEEDVRRWSRRAVSIFCSPESRKLRRRCIRRADYLMFTFIDLNIFRFNDVSRLLFYALGPTLLSDINSTILKQRLEEVKNFDIMIGHNVNDGWTVVNKYGISNCIKVGSDSICNSDKLIDQLKFFMGDFIDEVTLKDWSRRHSHLGDEKNLVSAVTGFTVDGPLTYTTRLLSKNNQNVFRYRFDSDVNETSHQWPQMGDEMNYFLGVPIHSKHSTDSQKHLSKLMLDCLYNFVKDGNPNGEGITQWPSYSHSSKTLIFGDNKTYLEDSTFDQDFYIQTLTNYIDAKYRELLQRRISKTSLKISGLVDVILKFDANSLYRDLSYMLLLSISIGTLIFWLFYILYDTLTFIHPVKLEPLPDPANCVYTAPKIRNRFPPSGVTIYHPRLSNTDSFL